MVRYFQTSFTLPTLTPHVAIFGIFDTTSNDYIYENNKAFINHILLIKELKYK